MYQAYTLTIQNKETIIPNFQNLWATSSKPLVTAEFTAAGLKYCIQFHDKIIHNRVGGIQN